ncbi:olfactory receptor 6N1-like [Menidia menidia]
MTNSTVLDFRLSAYLELGPFRYLGFVLVLAVYAVIVGSNLLLVVVICVNRSLHEPMYMFLCSLFVNELYGSTGLFPFLLVQILSDLHTVSAPFCFLQIFIVYTYGNVELLSLAVMSYDRYLAVCRPLLYHGLMTPQRAAILAALSWLLPALGILVTVALSASLPLCGRVIDRVYCGNYSIVKLSCSDTAINNVYGLVYTFVSLLSPLLLILYTYAQILLVCFSGSRNTRQKALSTCWPHLASTLNFWLGAVLQILQSRFDVSAVPALLAVVLSLYFLTCQPLLNPLLYGLKLPRVREACRRLLWEGRGGISAGG